MKRLIKHEVDTEDDDNEEWGGLDITDADEQQYWSTCASTTNCRSNNGAPHWRIDYCNSCVLNAEPQQFYRLYSVLLVLNTYYVLLTTVKDTYKLIRSITRRFRNFRSTPFYWSFALTRRIVLGVLVLYGFVMSVFSRRHWTFRVQPSMTVSAAAFSESDHYRCSRTIQYGS
jgi:hypothetical protein